MQPIEEWRPVVGYEGFYEASSRGRVRSVARIVTRVTGAKQFYPSRVLSAHFDGNYERVRLKAGGPVRTWTVHSLVAAAFLGPCPDGLEVCHNDGNPRDNSVANLRYDTHQSNVDDRRKHGTNRTRPDRWERCFRGHEYQSEVDYYISTAGAVKCLACDRAKGARYRARKAADAAAIVH